MEKIYEKVSDTEIKVTSPLEPEVETLTVVEIKAELANAQDIVVHYQSEVAHYEVLLAKCAELGVTEAATELPPEVLEEVLAEETPEETPVETPAEEPAVPAEELDGPQG